jgi:hypothetical protein
MKAYFENIYSNIGYLFYAIAAEQRKVSADEYQNLRKIITQKWQARPEMSRDMALQSHLNECMSNSVWVAYHNHMNPKKAFELFKDCFNLHQINVGVSLRQEIVATAGAIARDFPRISNGQRSELMKGLEQLLYKNPAVFANARPDQALLSINR